MLEITGAKWVSHYSVGINLMQRIYKQQLGCHLIIEPELVPKNT